jgi:hypothetical protein
LSSASTPVIFGQILYSFLQEIKFQEAIESAALAQRTDGDQVTTKGAMPEQATRAAQ